MMTMSIIFSFLVIALFGISAVSADHEYFQLKAPGGACLGRMSASGTDELMLKSCSFSDDTVLWRWDQYGRFHSKTNDVECIQAERSPDILAGPGVLEQGTQMYVKPCKTGSGIEFQSFDDDWEFDGLNGPLKLNSRPGLCMTHRGAQPRMGANIILARCRALGGDRAMGWRGVFSNYFVMKSFSGGCIARRGNGNDELFLKRCTGNDPNIQWRIDNMGRLQSKAAPNECMQVAQYPELLLGAEFIMEGTSVYSKTCGGELKDEFQMFNTLFPMPLVYPPQISGPLTLMARPDLCVVHFGADPTIGQSRIMTLDCDSLGGNRARGWQAGDPCDFPPFCLPPPTPRDSPDSKDP